MTKNTIAALLFVLLVAPAGSQSPTSTAQTRMAAVKTFAFGGTGFAGITSEGELLFNQIMSEPPAQAMQDLETIYATGNPQAQAYALAGIRKLDRDRFRTLLHSARESHAAVEIMSGCVVDKISLKRLAGRIDAGRYDLWLYPR
jgi:hypothetical protein